MRVARLLMTAALLAAGCTKFKMPVVHNGGEGGQSAADTGAGGGGGGGIDGSAGPSDSPGELPPASPCGNGVKESGEQCDDGAAQNTGGYGKCNPDCTRGPFCGDGRINGVDEACDNGPDNGLGPDACNPACTGFVRQRSILIFTQIGSSGNLTSDWDPFCQTLGGNYKALLVDGTTRIASTNPYAGDGQVDWVLKPYTRYVNAAGELLWAADQVALLGVRDAKPMPLLASFGGNGYAWVGFETDWTSSTVNCGRWRVASGGGGTALALGSSVATIDVTVLDCSFRNFVICVEQ